jgi:hypothetical protein
VSSTKDDDPDEDDDECADESGGDPEDLSADEREPDSTSEPS